MEKDKKSTPLLSVVNPSGIKLTTPPPFAGYDIAVLTDFLDFVFHAADPTDGAEPLCWQTGQGRNPGYPTLEADFLNILAKKTRPAALYYGTSRCIPDPDTGKPRNRKGLFSSLHVVVLDDIGYDKKKSKVHVDKLPKNFPPSYIIESSKGNFQYGYVLDKPVDNLAAAEGLIALVYEAGFSDDGGKMATKLVRLPGGVNGKKGVKADFPVTLVSTNGPTYTPQEIIDAMKLGVIWQDMLEDAEAVTKRRALLERGAGASVWSPIKVVAPSIGGVIDPVLEWLYKRDDVMIDNGGEWVDITCPWGEGHTDPTQITAGYAPTGRGKDSSQRGFHCFHANCSNYKTEEFLHYVAANEGPTAGRRDNAAELTQTYVFQPRKNGGLIWQIRGLPVPQAYDMSSFNGIHPHSVAIVHPDGKVKFVKETKLWELSHNKVIVRGVRFDPTTTDRIIERKKQLFLNIYTAPDWPSCTPDPHHVGLFNEYLNYLIPSDEEREYFIDWVAAKVQNMGFRGAGILMVANLQGIGRSTLAKGLRRLFGASNCATVEFDTLIGDNNFNEWEEKPMIFVDETLGGKTPGGFSGGYEKLKSRIDPAPQETVIRRKYGDENSVTVHSSFLLMSNHAAAISIPADDRRLYVIQNAPLPAEPSFYTKFHSWWLGPDESKPEDAVWGPHIWNHLKNRKVDLQRLLAPPPKTAGKDEMVDRGETAIEAVVRILCEIWPSEVVGTMSMLRCVNAYDAELNLASLNDSSKAVKAAIHRATTAYAKPRYPVHFEGKNVVPRVITNRMGSMDKRINPLNVSKSLPKKEITALLRDCLATAGDLSKIKQKLREEMEKADLI